MLDLTEDLRKLCTCAPTATLHACKGPCLALAQSNPSKVVNPDNIEHVKHAESKLEVKRVALG
jgi:hypothetical protein